MEDNHQSRFDRITTFLIIISLLAFLMIHNYDGKGPLPILMTAIMFLLAAPFEQKIFCFWLLTSWFGLWLVAFMPSLQKNWQLVICFFIPHWISVVWTYIRYDQYGTIWPVTVPNIWFWIPAIIFVMFSVLTVNKIFRQRRA